MLKALSSVLLFGCIAGAQLAPTVPPAAPQNSSQPPVEVAPDAPVITIDGFCPDAGSGTDAKSPSCKTVVTRAQFEKLIDTLNPKMPPQARSNVANDYAKMLVLSSEAKKRGLEDTQHYKDLVNFIKMQVAAQELLHAVQEQAKPTDAEIQKYYEDNASKYEEIFLRRVYIPRNGPTVKPTDTKPTEEQLKAEGEKIRTRLAAGEDFDKVQKEIYTAKGYTSPPPPTSIPNWRRESVPPAQAPLFDLKQGEMSQVMVEPAGVYIYKVEKKQTTPLDMVKSEIQAQLGSQKMRESMDALTSSIKPQLNEAYFRSVSGTPMGPGMVGPATASPHMTVAPTPASQRAIKPQPPAPQASTPKP
jgi:hypothetical protein